MKVYLVWDDEDYYGPTLLKIFLKKEHAEKYNETVKHMSYVDEWEAHEHGLLKLGKV